MVTSHFTFSGPSLARQPSGSHAPKCSRDEVHESHWRCRIWVLGSFSKRYSLASISCQVLCISVIREHKKESPYIRDGGAVLNESASI